MSLPVSQITESLLESQSKSPQLILEVDGWPVIASTPTQTSLVYGSNHFYGENIFYGGYVDDDAVLPYIDLSKSTNQITQQVLVDKGGFSSVTNFDVNIVDKDQLITSLVTPSGNIDVLSKKARLYLSFEGAAHPQDSLLFFSGIVSGVSAGAGSINLNLSSPEKLKNLKLFPKLSTEVTSNVLAGDTVINVTSTSDFSLPADGTTLETYIIIGDEYIKYTSKSDTSFIGCSRGQFGTIAQAHSVGDNVESAYRIQGNLRDLSLKIMLSGVNENYASDVEILSFNQYGSVFVQNAIFVPRYNFDQYYGSVPGDIVTITDSANPSNNGTTTINSIFSNDLGSYIILNKTLVNEGAGAKASFKSKYAVLPKFCGLEMTPDQVDVAEFETKYDQFSSNFFDYDFFIKDEVDGSEFINTEILFPSGCYALPRKAKTSLGTTIPPLGQYETKKLNAENITSGASLKINRNISNNFYNAVVIKYSQDQVTDKFTRGKISQSANSTNRIKVANKPITIEAMGVRSESNFEGKFNIISRRLLERYQYAAESIEVKTSYGAGFDIEVGDVVILDGSSLQLSDIKDGNGTRSFRPRLFEVQNKTLNIKGNPITFLLVDTAFGLNGRYGVVSPSSKLRSGSTTTTLKLKKSYGTTLRTTSEGYKWRNFSGYSVNVRSIDYTYFNESKIVGIDPADDDALVISPALPSAPLENYVVDVIKYPTSTDPETESIYKNIYVYFDKQLSVVSGISQTQFTVSALDAAKIKVGDIVLIHNKAFTNISVERNVTDITGTTITVDGALGYVPSLDDKIELIGFDDGGKPYRIL